MNLSRGGQEIYACQAVSLSHCVELLPTRICLGFVLTLGRDEDVLASCPERSLWHLKKNSRADEAKLDLSFSEPGNPRSKGLGALFAHSP